MTGKTSHCTPLIYDIDENKRRKIPNTALVVRYTDRGACLHSSALANKFTFWPAVSGSMLFSPQSRLIRSYFFFRGKYVFLLFKKRELYFYSKIEKTTGRSISQIGNFWRKLGFLIAEFLEKASDNPENNSDLEFLEGTERAQQTSKPCIPFCIQKYLVSLPRLHLSTHEWWHCEEIPDLRSFYIKEGWHKLCSRAYSFCRSV